MPVPEASATVPEADLTHSSELTDDADLKRTLARLLREAEQEYRSEARREGNDDDWSEWWASYLLEHLPEMP
ncbi:MAG TPA: hypothetical protein VFB34_11050 [Chloroflexota bacterium]|nr:hypothetical protein [Chloroflexota bacterium]